MSLIPRLSLPGGIFEHDVAELENAHWESVRAVLADGFEQSWQEGCADYLEFEGFGVGDFYSQGTGVGTVHEGKVFFV